MFCLPVPPGNGHSWLRGAIVLVFSLTLIAGLLLWGPGVEAAAAIALSQQPATEVKVLMGTETGELKFVPNQLQLAANTRYKLVLSNPSPQKHYFTAKDFADAVWTQKVEAGNVEIKGAIHELELKPGAKAEWVFVTLKPGSYGLRCTIAGHTEAGMIGTIQITDQTS